MKKGLMAIGVAVILVLCMAACGNKKVAEGSVVDKTEEAKPEANKEEVEEKVEEIVPEEPEVEEPAAPASVTVTIYCGNANADGYDSEDVSIPEVTPEALLQQLANKNVLPAEVTVLNFAQTQVNGQNAIDLDLSSEYGSYIETRGTAGEKMSIGSIVNTFLKAYNCESIRITVAGGTLMTGHREYPDYMTMF